MWCRRFGRALARLIIRRHQAVDPGCTAYRSIGSTLRIRARDEHRWLRSAVHRGDSIAREPGRELARRRVVVRIDRRETGARPALLLSPDSIDGLSSAGTSRGSREDAIRRHPGGGGATRRKSSRAGCGGMVPCGRAASGCAHRASGPRTRRPAGHESAAGDATPGWGRRLVRRSHPRPKCRPHPRGPSPASACGPRPPLPSTARPSSTARDTPREMLGRGRRLAPR